MPLTDIEKNELGDQFQLLGELNEPEALLATVQRACARAAQSIRNTPDLAKRWSIVANALIEAEATVMAMQSRARGLNPAPERAKLEAQQWPETAETPRRSNTETPNPPAAA